MNRYYAWIAGGLSIALALCGQANAQVSDIPSADRHGNFNSAIIRGNRGLLGNHHWLLMAQPDGFLNCRTTPNGTVRSVIVPGAIITAKFSGPLKLDGGQTPNPAADAIATHNGRPWLRITGTQSALILPPPRNRYRQNYIGECYVRANSQYIVPVNNDVELQ